MECSNKNNERKRNIMAYQKIWSKVKFENNWEVLTVTVGGQPFVMPKPKKLVVQFPDGTEAKLPVAMRSRTVTVNDMGNSYEQSSEYPVVILSYLGLKFDVSLDKVKVAAGQ